MTSTDDISHMKGMPGEEERAAFKDEACSTDGSDTRAAEIVDENKRVDVEGQADEKIQDEAQDAAGKEAAESARWQSLRTLSLQEVDRDDSALSAGNKVQAGCPHHVAHDEGRTRSADGLDEDEADEGPGEVDLPPDTVGANGGGDFDRILRDDRDRPRETVSLQLGNSDRYEGEVLDGLMDGRGHYTFADGNVYVGEWRLGKKEGSGTFSWTNGDVYDGEWIDGKMAGRGRIVLVNRLTYDGEWFDGKCHGKGECC